MSFRLLLRVLGESNGVLGSRSRGRLMCVRPPQLDRHLGRGIPGPLRNGSLVAPLVGCVE